METIGVSFIKLEYRSELDRRKGKVKLRKNLPQPNATRFGGQIQHRQKSVVAFAAKHFQQPHY